MLKAITRKVSSSINHCELTHLERELIDIELANAQHASYEKMLQNLGVEVVSLPAVPDLPDSVFVEDTALVLDEIAILTRPGADSRKREVESISKALKPFRELVRIVDPGTLDGGDILIVDDVIFVGISSRSNKEGIQQLERIVKPFGYIIRGIPVRGALHLKSAVTMVANKTLLINPLWLNKSHFEEYKLIEIDPTETYAANALLINSTVVYQPSFPRTAEKLARQGLELRMVDASELGKAEGALTCCSLIFKK